jgi:hypothetical protein
VPPTVCLSPAPSFAGEVRPVLEKRCFGCHAGDGVAADEHDFSKMDRLRVDRSAILDEVATCSMPPRSVLADADADTLLRWAVCAPSTE